MEQVSMPLWMMLTILTGLGAIIMFILNRALDTLKAILNEISTDVKITNGQIVKLNTWTQMHEKQDDERHKEVLAVHDDIWSKMERRKGI